MRAKCLCDAHVRLICPVRDVIHVRKCARPSSAFPYCSNGKLVEGLGTRLDENTLSQIVIVMKCVEDGTLFMLRVINCTGI